MYTYVGPRELLRRVADDPAGSPIRRRADLTEWMKRQHARRPVPATFVIGCEGMLLLAERHSEHVICAGGAPVLAAGELVLEGVENPVVTSITNQSTGYCPEGSSWDAVEKTFSQLGLTFPEGFTHTFTFRRCGACGQINVVKDGDYTCPVCLHALPVGRNL